MDQAALARRLATGKENGLGEKRSAPVNGLVPSRREYYRQITTAAWCR